MNRSSDSVVLTDAAGEYVQEVFACDSPKYIIIGVHGNGVRRWDGEKFYYQVAEQYADSVVILFDQNQPEGDGVRLNTIEQAVARVERCVEYAANAYPGLPIWVMAHSMGCAVTALADLSVVTGVLFVAPAAGGKQREKLVERYGADVLEGKTVLTSDGLTKVLPKEYIDSVADLAWKDIFADTLTHFTAIHVFESGADEIIDESDRRELRDMPFASYTIIKGAPHNFSGEYSRQLFEAIDAVL